MWYFILTSDQYLFSPELVPSERVTHHLQMSHCATPLPAYVQNVLHTSGRQNHMIHQSPALLNHGWVLCTSLEFMDLHMECMHCSQLLLDVRWHPRVRSSCATITAYLSIWAPHFMILYSQQDQVVRFSKGRRWYYKYPLPRLCLTPGVLGQCSFLC